MACVVKDIPIGDEEDEQKRNTMLDELTTQLKANQKISVQNGYPTIFKLDDHNNVVYHEGERTLDNLYQFFTGRPFKHPGQNLIVSPGEKVLPRIAKKKTQRGNKKRKTWKKRPKTRRARKPRKF